MPEGAVKKYFNCRFYNDLDSVKAHFEEHDDIAGVIIEPIAGNMGVVNS